MMKQLLRAYIKKYYEQAEKERDEALSLAKKYGVEDDELQNAVNAVGLQFFKEGKFAESDKTANDFPNDEVEKGTKVEYEHTKNSAIAKKIALDHLTESDQYYIALEKMEKEL